VRVHVATDSQRYFLSYQDAASVCEGLIHQDAHPITFAMITVGVIDFVNKGKAGLNSTEAAEFIYLLSQPNVSTTMTTTKSLLATGLGVRAWSCLKRQR
jgi:hypothetical protein